MSRRLRRGIVHPLPVPRIHYTELTAPSCWICAALDEGELCHVHDPKMRKYLAVKGEDAMIDVAEKPLELSWTVSDEVGDG